MRRSAEIPELAFGTAAEAAEFTDAGEIVVGADAARRTRLELRGAGDLPTAQQLLSHVALPFEEGQIVDVVHNRDVPRVIFRRSPQVARVVGVGDDVAVVRPTVHALGVGVGDAETRAALERARPGNL